MSQIWSYQLSTWPEGLQPEQIWHFTGKGWTTMKLLETFRFGRVIGSCRNVTPNFAFIRYQIKRLEIYPSSRVLSPLLKKGCSYQHSSKANATMKQLWVLPLRLAQIRGLWDCYSGGSQDKREGHSEGWWRRNWRFTTRVVHTFFFSEQASKHTRWMFVRGILSNKWGWRICPSYNVKYLVLYTAFGPRVSGGWNI